MLTKDRAVCVRAVDYSETSQVVTLFARENGKISAIAKGSRRAKSAFDGPIELFAHGSIVYSQSNKDKLATLTEFQQKMPFQFLTSNLFALHCASLACELINLTIDDYDPHPELFDAFIKYLEDTDRLKSTAGASRDMFALLITFQLQLLKEIGLMPILDHCVNCKTSVERRVTSDEFYFSSSANGLVCRDCEAAFPDKVKLSGTAAKILVNRQGLKLAEEKTLRQIEKVLITHFTEMLHRPPRMAKYILRT